MYAKGMSTAQHTISVTICLTGTEVFQILNRNGETENKILENIENQIRNTREFAAKQTQGKSFAKAVNQAANGLVVFIALTDEDADGILNQDEVIESEILNHIENQCLSVQRHLFNKKNKVKAQAETVS